MSEPSSVEVMEEIQGLVAEEVAILSEGNNLEGLS